MKYNIILRFLEYEKRENYIRLLYLITNLTLYEIKKNNKRI